LPAADRHVTDGDGAVSFLGDSLSRVALVFQVAETTGHTLAVAMLLLAADSPPRCSDR
jgi:hypothetical protein